MPNTPEQQQKVTALQQEVFALMNQRDAIYIQASADGAMAQHAKLVAQQSANVGLQMMNAYISQASQASTDAQAKLDADNAAALTVNAVLAQKQADLATATAALSQTNAFEDVSGQH